MLVYSLYQTSVHSKMTKQDTGSGLLCVYPDVIMFVFVKLQQYLNIIELSPPSILQSN